MKGVSTEEHTISAEEAQLQCKRGCAVQIGHAISTVEVKVYSTGLPKLLRGFLVVVLNWENDILQTVGLILLLSYSDLDEILLIC